jgi:hypothetical protein
MGSVLFSFICLLLLLLFVGWNETEFTWNIDHYWAYCTKPWMMDEHEAVNEMEIGRENQSTWRKPAPIPFCSP